MTQASTTGSMGTGKSDERVIYYRKPSNGGPEDGWIVWGDSESGTKLRDRAILGFQPLFDYGAITGYMDREQKIPDPGSVWGPILRHPDGPAEFPISQIVALRWHIDPPIPVKFPQLQGMKITQYQCPECSRAPFAELKEGDKVVLSAIKSLGNHLTIMHKWDRLALLKWGDRAGIDFDAVDAKVEVPYVYEEEPEVEDVVVETKTAEVVSCQSCGDKIPGKLADHECQPVTA
jgi:DNA-directed RNA polymerase subunit RPC12/RpoP